MRTIFCLLAFSVCLQGCVAKKFDINAMTVSEENSVSMKLQKITENSDGVVHPNVENCRYVANKFFDISKDGKKLAFIGTKNYRSSIFIKDFSSLKSSLQRTFSEDVLDVTFSNSGESLAFSSVKGAGSDIFSVSSMSGSAIRQLATSSQNTVKDYPFYSKNDDLVYFVQREPGSTYILTKKLENSVIYYDRGPEVNFSGFIWAYNLKDHILTQYLEGGSPSLSPDGKIIAMTRIHKETKKSEIWLYDIDKGQEFLLLSSKDDDYFNPSISPDGRRLSFVKKTKAMLINKTEKTLGITHSLNNEMILPDNLDIFVCNMDGSNLTQITFHPAHDISPVWGPEGKSLFFLSQRGSVNSDWNIWRMDLNQ